MNDYRILKGGECASVAGAAEDQLLTQDPGDNEWRSQCS